MTPEQRQRLIEILLAGGEVAPEWSRILFPPEKREYELVYHGKEREEDVIANTPAVPLQPVRTFNKSGVAWHNKLIFGDNLQAMKSLLEMKRRGELCNADGTPGVRLVYIDPPFATMQEFQGSEDQKAYQDKIIGSRFVEFLRKRLVLIRELLSSDGAVFVHLDWKKVHYLKVIMDEVLGENNFRNEIVWHYPGREMHISNKYNAKHDTILFYSRSTETKIRMDQVSIPYDRDERLKSLRRKVHVDDNGKEWVWETRGQAAGQEAYKRYVDEIIAQGRALSDVWSDIQFLRGNHPERTGYPTQKPLELLERVIKGSSSAGDIVLDAFAGSGTTCAVAEKLGRRWIGIDCGKLAIYTIQKRMLNLKADIANVGAPLKAKPFTLYNAGLYDFARLKELPWGDWRRFALTLFGCQDEPHRIGGIQFDGTLKACPVQVFDHHSQDGATISEDTLRSVHEAAGSKIGTRMFIIAPSLAFDFQQDYIQIGEVRYYALRIPYSIIHELHQRDFLALKQPTDEMAVNDTVDAVGFDFIKTPELEYTVGRGNSEGELLEEAFIRIDSFYSEAAVREPMQKRGNRETLSMVMLDYGYDADADVFDLDDVYYAKSIEAAGWEVRFPANRLGDKVMAVFLDIYGNEARVVISATAFAPVKPSKRASANTASQATTAKKQARKS